MSRRNDIAKIIVHWCIENGEEFLPNPLADRIESYLRSTPDETPAQEPVCAYCGKPEEHFAHNQDGHAFQEPEFRWWCMECGAKLYTEVEMREHEHKGKSGYIAGMNTPAPPEDAALAAHPPQQGGKE